MDSRQTCALRRAQCHTPTRLGRAAAGARPPRAAPRSPPLLKASPSQLRPIFLPPLMLRHRRSIEPFHFRDRFDIPQRLHLVARSAHQLIRLAWIDRVWRRMFGDEAGCFAASQYAAHPVLALQQGVVLTAGEIGSFHGSCLGGRASAGCAPRARSRDVTRRARASGEKARAALRRPKACPWPCRRAGARVPLSAGFHSHATSASGIAARQGRAAAGAAARRGTRKSPTAFGGDAQTDPIQRQPRQSLRQFSICKRPVKTALQGAKPLGEAGSPRCRSEGHTARPASEVSQARGACGTKTSSTLRPCAVRRIYTTTSTAC